MIDINDLADQLKLIAESTSGRWEFKSGEFDGYGLMQAPFVQVSDRETSRWVRVLVNGNETRLGARISPIAEISEDLSGLSVNDVADMAALLVFGRYETDEGHLSMIVAGRRLVLDIWNTVDQGE